MSRQPTLSDSNRQLADGILKKLMQEPEKFGQPDIRTLLKVTEANPDEPFCPEELIDTTDLRRLMLRIFDQNEDFKFDNANTGYLNLLNNFSQGRRNRKFFKTIRVNPSVKRIVAEGDSWFEHPIVDDVIDWLNKLGKGQYVIYSLARGGDFLTNILEEREYITELSLYRPEVFLLSAGGIELVNGRRVALMIDRESNYVTEEYQQTHPLIRDVLVRGDLNEDQQIMFQRGLSFLTKEHFVLLAVLELSYKYLIKQLRKKFADLTIITHGYDYTVPSFQKGPGVLKYLINLIGGNGHHFKEPMLIRGVTDEQDQRSICFAMIHLFNEVMIKIATDSIFGSNVYHIDCRGYAQDSDWHDELHLKPRSIKPVAETYLEAINHGSQDRKVFKVRSTNSQPE